MKPKVVVGIVLGLLFVVLLLQNTQVVSVRVLFWQVSMSRVIFFPLVLLAGFAMGFIVGRKPWDR